MSAAWRWGLFAAGLALSIALSLLLHGLFLFLLFPFFFALGWPRRSARTGSGWNGPAPRRCPTCGLQTTDPEVRYCPRDGSRLG